MGPRNGNRWMDTTELVHFVDQESARSMFLIWEFNVYYEDCSTPSVFDL